MIWAFHAAGRSGDRPAAPSGDSALLAAVLGGHGQHEVGPLKLLERDQPAAMAGQVESDLVGDAQQPAVGREPERGAEPGRRHLGLDPGVRELASSSAAASGERQRLPVHTTRTRRRPPRRSRRRKLAGPAGGHDDDGAPAATSATTVAPAPTVLHSPTPARGDGGADAEEGPVADDDVAGDRHPRSEVGELADEALVVDEARRC